MLMIRSADFVTRNKKPELSLQTRSGFELHSNKPY